MACIALFVAMGGVGYAAATINSGDIVDNTVKSKDVRNGGLQPKDIEKNALGGGRIKESSLSQVPSAANASSATTAADAAALGGTPAGGYLKADARGVAVAGASLNSDGSLESWFNRAGGAPTVTHSSEGDYEIAFPGHNITFDTHVATVSIIGTLGTATPDYSGGELHVRSFTGNLAMDTWDLDDRRFNVTLHAASAAG